MTALFFYREVLEYINLTRHSADSGVNTSQLQCYGIGEIFTTICFHIFHDIHLPADVADGCTYWPVHTDDCLRQMWLNLTECIEMGSAFPVGLSTAERNQYFISANYKEILEMMARNATVQMECYGFSELALYV